MELNALMMNILAWIGIISGLGFATWWYISLYAVRNRKKEIEESKAPIALNSDETLTSVPISLVIFMAFIGITLVVYVAAIWLSGVSF